MEEIIIKAFDEVSSLIRYNSSHDDYQYNRNDDDVVDDNGIKIEEEEEEEEGSSNTSVDGGRISDSIRLQLYGYYKCATSPPSRDDGVIVTASLLPPQRRKPRPSFLDPVGRAKYDAHTRIYTELYREVAAATDTTASSDGTGDDATSASFSTTAVVTEKIRILAMKHYIETAASQTHHGIGRKCAIINHEMQEELDHCGGAAAIAASTATGGGSIASGATAKKSPLGHEVTSSSSSSSASLPSAEMTASTTTTTKVDGSTTTTPSSTAPPFPRRKQAIPSSSTAPNWGTTLTKPITPNSSTITTTSFLSSYLPPPLLPRGQLDISIRDLLYALSICLLHGMHSLLVEGILSSSLVNRLLPNCIKILLDMIFVSSTFHPRRWGQMYEKEIERVWLEDIDVVGAISTKSDNIEGDGKNDEDYLLEDSHCHHRRHVVVGLSVRTLLDLYLSTKSFPVGSEVIIVPPVSIPGMVGVLEYHGMTLVPVDLPTSGGARTKKEDEDDEQELISETLIPANYCYWGLNTPGVEAAVSSRTVAILVVHPFGAVMSPLEMKILRRIANERGLEIWEDCAQCYTGGGSRGERGSSDTRQKILSPKESVSRFETKQSIAPTIQQPVGYTGSRCANISFFSFGPIKTSTALGGGLAILREEQKKKNEKDGAKKVAINAEETSKTMRRIQETMYTSQTNVSYLLRIGKCFVLHLISQSRFLCGLVKCLVVQFFGWDYDDFLVSVTRGFSTPTTAMAMGTPTTTTLHGRSNDNKKVEDVEHDASNNRARAGGDKSHNSNSNQLFIRQLRRRPCPAMMSLLHRRLLDSESTISRERQRRNRCRSFARQLRSDLRIKNKISLLENVDDGVFDTMYGWVFPVQLPNPKRASELLLSMGYDAPRGMTQLKPIIAFDENNVDECPRARLAFDHILYLPVTNSSFTSKDSKELIDALADVVTCTTSPAASCPNVGFDERSHSVAREDGEKALLAPWKGSVIFTTIAALCEWCFPNPVHFTFRLVIMIAPWIAAGLACTVLSLLMLSRHMGPIYLKSSNTFANYCGMLFRSPFQNAHNGIDDENKLFMQSKTILELESTKVPSVGVARIGEPIKESNDLPMVIVTGATGFIGSLLLRELLLHRHSLSIGGVIVIVRTKRGKSACVRIDRLLSQSMFDFLDDTEKQAVVHVVEGDVSLPSCGLRSEAIKSLCQRNVSHVFHCAAAVSFSQSLEDAALSNITSTLQLLQLTKTLRRADAKFVYISTAFVHGGNTGSKSKPLPQETYSLQPYDPVELYKSMLGSQSYASAAMNELGFPNTYTFSKCICEHLLQANDEVNTIIIRPSIVGPSVQEPFEGWSGEKPSTIVAAACLYLMFPFNMWCFGKDRAPFVPVDVVCRFVVSKSFGDQCKHVEHAHHNSFEDEKKESTPFDISHESTHNTIATVSWDASSLPNTTFSWVAYAYTVTHLGAVCGHVNRVIAYTGLLFSTKLFPWLNFNLNTFQRLHFMFVRIPLDVVLDVCARLPWKGRILSDLKALSPLIDLPMLFFPFANKSFFFESDFVPPSDFNGGRYMFSCAVAAHRFIEKIKEQRKRRSSRHHDSNVREYNDSSRSILIAGVNHVKPISDLWWALTQPKGSIFIRFGGWILSKIFRFTSMEIEVDIASFQILSRALSSSTESETLHVVFAPTHRSFYDFLIVSYICFSLPELGLDMPHIAAASDFESIPLIGWLARKLQAFYLNRSGSKKEHNLEENLMNITKSRDPVFIEFFIEGKRSRNGTFNKPKTGFLRCLARTANDYIILPLTINYESIPDQTSLINEANYGHREEMSLGKLSKWMHNAITGRVFIGRVYVSASEATSMPKVSGRCINELAASIQTRQQSRVMVSNYHIKATALVLDLSEKEVTEALLELRCQRWPSLSEKSPMHVPHDCDFQWAAMLHFGHLLGPFLAGSHPKWSRWISPCANTVDVKVQHKALQKFLSRLMHCFEAAEIEVDKVLKLLQSKGFDAPDEKHIIQYLPIDANVPLFLMQEVVKEKVSANVPFIKSNANQYHRHDTIKNSPIFQCTTAADTESFGAWGYQDSYFVLNVGPNGSKYVQMKGSRYSISGKHLSFLVPFVEYELNIVIDPKDHVFAKCNDLSAIPMSTLSSDDIGIILTLLGNDKSRISCTRVDRARRGTGHTQKDLYELRTGVIGFRVPDAVVWPKNEREVEALVSTASEYDWCLIPFGGGTNVTHSTHCPPRDIDLRPMISVDMKLMSHILWVNEEDGLVNVQAGITGRELIQSMAKRGFTIGHEPDSYEFSTLGGWIATKASGMKQNRYGNIEDIVREVCVIGGNGRMSHNHMVDKTSIGRSSMGIDLKSIMLGSEGCMGIIVSAVLKIWPIADLQSYESVLLPDLDVGIQFIKDVAKMRGLKPASVRLLDNDQFRLGQALKGSDLSWIESIQSYVMKRIGFHFGNLSEKSVVCATIAFEGTCAEVKFQKKCVRDLAHVHGGFLAGSKVGKSGYDLTFAIAYLRDFAIDYNILSESFETFVPWSKIQQLIQATKQSIYAEHKNRSLPGNPFVCCRITQIYDDGVCVYFYFCMSMKGVSDPSNVFSCIERSARREIMMNGGTLSHHHGLGKLRSEFAPYFFSQGYVDALVSMKAAIDPMNTFGARNGIFAHRHELYSGAEQVNEEITA